ncbi:MAG: hypothetical protein ACTS22_06405 [Phycisphaerales bacterium]
MEPNDLIRDVRWWELGGHETDSLNDAWRAVHHASQVIAEVGKAWAAPRADDSHSSMIWLPSPTLQNQLLAGEIVEGTPALRAVLRPWDLHLFVIDGSGEPLGSSSLQGRSVDDGLAWIRGVVESVIGPPRQESRPAPDLPDHPVADGAAFEEPSQLAVAEVLRLYGNADAVLMKLGELVEDSDTPRAWPHHFDIASLITVARDEHGGASRTIGVGLTPPDTLVGEGYWYVSPWSASDEPTVSKAAWPDLEWGRWIERDGGMPMAVLPVSETSSTDDPSEQHGRTVSFIAQAFEACRKAQRDG